MRPLLAALLCVAAIGCGNKESTARKPVEDPARPTEDTRVPPDEARGGAVPEPPPAADPRALEIKPTGRPGWAADSRPVSDLGQRVDAALAGAKETLCESETMFDVAGDKASAKLVFRIRDEDTYFMEWVEPASKAEVNSIVRDGGRMAKRIGGKQGAAQPWAKSEAPVGIESFLENPTRAMLAGFEAGQSPWAGLFADLESGKGGFKATRETSKRTVNGAEREIVRVVAQSAAGDSLEAVIDGTSNLPLTLRVKRANGESYLWTGKWARGGQHTDANFRLP